MPKKKTILDFYKMKETGEKVTWMTAYDYPQASFLEAAGIDMILVGDSLGMIVLGYDGTIPVTMDDCMRHTPGRAPRRAQHVRDRRHAVRLLPDFAGGCRAERGPFPQGSVKSTPSSWKVGSALPDKSRRSSTPASSASAIWA